MKLEKKVTSYPATVLALIFQVIDATFLLYLKPRGGEGGGGGRGELGRGVLAIDRDLTCKIHSSLARGTGHIKANV